MAFDAPSSFEQFNPLLDKITIEDLKIQIPENTTLFSVLHTEPKQIYFKDLQGKQLETVVAKEGWIKDLVNAGYKLQSDIHPTKE